MATRKRIDIRRAAHSRIRRKVKGSAERPRLAIFRSVNHIYAQIIDDENGKTLAAASTTEKDLKKITIGGIEAAQRIGKAIAERALAAGVSQVVYDRGGYVYHGRVKALFEATREAGLIVAGARPVSGVGIVSSGNVSRFKGLQITDKHKGNITERYVHRRVNEENIESQIKDVIKEIKLKNSKMDKTQKEIAVLRSRSDKRQQQIDFSLSRLKELLNNV